MRSFLQKVEMIVPRKYLLNDEDVKFHFENTIAKVEKAVRENKCVFCNKDKDVCKDIDCIKEVINKLWQNI